jgi:hypothetical protein
MNRYIASRLLRYITVITVVTVCVRKENFFMYHPYYQTCPTCGAHLDPGERCTCTMDLAARKQALAQEIKGLTEPQAQWVLAQIKTMGGEQHGEHHGA